MLVGGCLASIRDERLPEPEHPVEPRLVRAVRRGHVIALVGALALLLVMAMDWYSTATGDEARRIEDDHRQPVGRRGAARSTGG